MDAADSQPELAEIEITPEMIAAGASELSMRLDVTVSAFDYKASVSAMLEVLQGRSFRTAQAEDVFRGLDGRVDDAYSQNIPLAVVAI